MNINIDKPLLTFCFNTEAEIWEQDMYNNQLFNRVHDVLSHRTNQIFPNTNNNENKLNQSKHNYSNLKQNNYIMSQSFNKNIDLNDNFNESYNSIPYPKLDHSNLMNTNLENDLIYGLNTPLMKECLTINEAININDGNKNSNRRLYRKYHSNEINHSQYPNIDNNLFNNVTKEIYKTIDDRNKFIIQI